MRKILSLFVLVAARSLGQSLVLSNTTPTDQVVVWSTDSGDMFFAVKQGETIHVPIPRSPSGYGVNTQDPGSWGASGGFPDCPPGSVHYVWLFNTGWSSYTLSTPNPFASSLGGGGGGGAAPADNIAWSDVIYSFTSGMFTAMVAASWAWFRQVTRDAE